jgi:hypothetical protein
MIFQLNAKDCIRSGWKGMLVCVFLLPIFAITTVWSAEQKETRPILDREHDCIRLCNKDQAIVISILSPALKIGEISLTPVRPEQVTDQMETQGRVSCSYAPFELGGARLRVEQSFEWNQDEKILRKYARIMLDSNSKPEILHDVVLERMDVTGVLIEGPLGALQSYPAFLKGFFTGIEFPIANVGLEGNILRIGCKPGTKLIPGQWYETRRAIFGLAVPGREKEDFRNYIARHRAGHNNIHFNYNDWWTTTGRTTEKSYFEIMAQLRQNLYKPYGIGFDSYCLDLGWSEPKSLWKINATNFPSGFDNLKARVDEMNGHLGLWISPCGAYPEGFDTKWASEQGYESCTADHWTGPNYHYMCMVGPKYRTEFANTLCGYIKKYNISQVKLDFFKYTCEAADHGHEPGTESAEALADSLIDVTRQIYRTKPDIWLETFCFHSNSSPWWLFYVNSALGNQGDDKPCGRIPCPIYNESYTSGRDYFCLQGAFMFPSPMAALETVGLIVQTSDPWMNDAVSNLMRGHQFVAHYINPKMMKKTDWAKLADYMRWAKANAPRFTDRTIPILPASWQANPPKFERKSLMPRELYGYKHPGSDGGLICLRNPWIKPGVYKLKLDEDASASPGDRNLNIISIYPEKRSYSNDLAFGTVVDIPIAPYETVVLSISKKADSGKTPVSATQAIGHYLSADKIQTSFKRVLYDKMGHGPDWTDLAGQTPSALQVNYQCVVENKAPKTEMLVLLEGKGPLNVPRNEIRINGRKVTAEVIDSESGFSAQAEPNHPEYWMFLSTPLSVGSNNVNIELFLDNSVTTASLWCWARRPASGVTDTSLLPSPDEISIDGIELLAPIAVAEVKCAEVHDNPPIEKINGVFLDSLDPVASHQGWGELERNRSVVKKPINIVGHRYLRGLGTHANAEIEYKLNKQFRRFEAWVGGDYFSSLMGPTISFEVWVDGQKKFDSGLMTKNDPPKQVAVDLTGADSLKLVVKDGGDGSWSDYADWANAKLLH